MFTLVTHPVGARICFQLAAVEYGATLSTYVLFSVVTIAISHCSALDKLVKSELVDTTNVSVNATHGNVDDARCPLASNTGMFPLDVPVSFVAAVPMLPPSFIFFPVVPSNTAKCQSVAPDGHKTSQLHSPAGHCGQTGHCGHCAQVSPLSPLAPVSHLSHLSHLSPLGHWIP